jgi:photosystem I subunit 2
MQCALSAKVSLAGSRVSAQAQRPRQQASRLVVRAVEPDEGRAAAAEAAPAGQAASAPKAEPKPWAPPALNADTPSPIFGGSTGAWGGPGVGRRVCSSWRDHAPPSSV